MAVKIFGECSGSSGSKYNIWVEVNENSHSIKNNTSNLTIRLKLKRNDGYSSSAYNLNKSENYTKITINNSVKSSCNLTIDTRNSSVVTLCEWTGDVLHDTSGKLSIEIAGSFTMSGTSLDGGVVSGNFNCVTIPRITPFTLNKSIVNCGESVSVTLTPYSQEFNHKITYSMNGVSLSENIEKGTTQIDLAIPNEWAYQLPNSNQGIISLNLKTYIGTQLIGSTTRNVKLTIPSTEEFIPGYEISFSTNSKVESTLNLIIQNKSTITVNIKSFAGKFGATMFSSYIILGDVKKQGTTAEFELPDAGTITFNIRVIDSRGLYKDEKLTCFVEDYSSPSFKCNNIFRCNTDGTPNENGTSVLIDFTKKISFLRGYNVGQIKVKYKKSNETDYSSLVSLVSSPFVLNGNFEKESSYDFLFQITDSVTKTPIETVRTIATASIPFNIKRGGSGAAFGCYAETENELTVGYNLNIKGSLIYNDLTDLCLPENNVTIEYLSFKKYDCLGLSILKCQLIAKEIIPANNWIKVMTIPVSCPVAYTPINIISFKMVRDQNLFGAIRGTGEIFISTAEQFNKDERIYITCYL